MTDTHSGANDKEQRAAFQKEFLAAIEHNDAEKIKTLIETNNGLLTERGVEDGIFDAIRRNVGEVLSELIRYAKEKEMDWQGLGKEHPYVIVAACEIASQSVDILLAEGASAVVESDHGSDALEHLFYEVGFALCGSPLRWLDDLSPFYELMQEDPGLNAEERRTLAEDRKTRIREAADHIARALLEAGAEPTSKVYFLPLLRMGDMIDVAKIEKKRGQENPMIPALLEWDAKHPRKYFGVFGPRTGMQAAPV